MDSLEIGLVLVVYNLIKWNFKLVGRVELFNKWYWKNWLVM